MLPHYNSFPHHSNQVQSTPAPGSFAPPHQMQPQLGTKNPQIPMQFSNTNTPLSNGHGVAMPNMPTSMIAQANFLNVPNNLLSIQNNHPGMPQFSSVGPASQPCQPHAGFYGSQNNAHGTNSVSSFPFHGQLPQFCNLGQNGNQVISSQLPGHLFGQNLLSLPQQFNQNMGFPYGQFCMPNPLQMNQFVPMQMQNPSQVGPSYAFAGSNQAPQATVSQNPPFFVKQQFGNVHTNHVSQQVNQNQQNLLPPAMQGTQFVQGNHTKTSAGGYSSNSSWKHSPSKSFPKHPKREVQPQGGFQNSQFHHAKNAKGKFAFPKGHKGKGLRNDSGGKSALANSMNQGNESKRSLSLSYTEQEIQQWREERRKNYPSKSIIEKKLSENLIDSEVIERESKRRREQLKDILTKQAELGVEVAEIPSYYLTDSNQGRGREEKGSWTKKGSLPNKFGKRGKYDKKDRFAKRQRSHYNKDSSNDPSFSKREPTLLQKLLSDDIRRDRSRLQQVFRFMVTNSFFKDCPDKPLKFPTIAVKESGCKEGVAEESSSLAGKDSKGSNNSMVERVYTNDFEDCNDYCTNDDDGGDEDADEEGIERPEEEEGEIIN